MAQQSQGNSLICFLRQLLPNEVKEGYEEQLFLPQQTIHLPLHSAPFVIIMKLMLLPFFILYLTVHVSTRQSPPNRIQLQCTTVVSSLPSPFLSLSLSLSVWVSLRYTNTHTHTHTHTYENWGAFFCFVLLVHLLLSSFTSCMLRAFLLLLLSLSIFLHPLCYFD